MNDRQASTPPQCPITDQPAVRNVQWIKAGFLVRAWKHIMGVNARPSFGTVQKFGLWESPTGLYFFDPMTEGDHEFYSTFYAYLIKKGLGDWLVERGDQRMQSQSTVRKNFSLAASRIAPGQRVLDIGCGFGRFRSVVPHAEYVGLDPNFATQSRVEGVIDQSLQDHLSAYAGTYDAVCAFEVIEHLASPSAFFADMVRAARPGGLVIVSVPSVRGASTEIPNFLLNAPPHHLTWWTPAALAALAARHGAVVESIESVPWSEDDALVYWMARCSPIRCRDTHYRNVWWWHAAALVSYLGGRLASKVAGVPKTKTGDDGSGLLMVARRRG